MHYDYLLVGAGLYNAVFCEHAVRAGKTCLVVERSEEHRLNPVTRLGPSRMPSSA